MPPSCSWGGRCLQHCLAEVVVLLWRKPCFVCSCLALVSPHNCAFLFYFKASWNSEPSPAESCKAKECHVSNEPCGRSDGPTEAARQGAHTQACTGIPRRPLSTGRHAGPHCGTPWAPPGYPTPVFFVSEGHRVAS